MKGWPWVWWHGTLCRLQYETIGPSIPSIRPSTPPYECPFFTSLSYCLLWIQKMKNFSSSGEREGGSPFFVLYKLMISGVVSSLRGFFRGRPHYNFWSTAMKLKDPPRRNGHYWALYKERTSDRIGINIRPAAVLLLISVLAPFCSRIKE